MDFSLEFLLNEQKYGLFWKERCLELTLGRGQTQAWNRNLKILKRHMQE